MNEDKYTNAPFDIEDAMKHAIPVEKPYFMNVIQKPESILNIIQERWLEPLPKKRTI